MFDVGFTENLLLSLVGLMVLGPERLPRVARTLGGMARKARSSWLSLKRQIEAEMRAEELKEPLQHFKNEVKSATDVLNSGVQPAKKADSPESGSPEPESSKAPAPSTPPGNTDTERD